MTEKWNWGNSMEFNFYVIKGETAKRIGTIYRERMKVVKKLVDEWEEKYKPLLVCSEPYHVASYEPIIPSNFGLTKGRKRDGKYFYEFKLNTMRETNKYNPMYKEYIIIHKTNISLKETVKAELQFPFNDYVFEPIFKGGVRGCVHYPNVFIDENVPDTIFIENPIDNERECFDTHEIPTLNHHDIMKVKESEFLALLGR